MLATQRLHTPGGWPIRVQADLRRSRLRPLPPALAVARPNGGKTSLSFLLSLGAGLNHSKSYRLDIRRHSICSRVRLEKDVSGLFWLMPLINTAFRKVMGGVVVKNDGIQ